MAATSSAVNGQWYERGMKSFQAKKFRKGACTNCGSMTHSAKDCMERPRKLGAVHTGKEICADEVVHEALALGFDAKRDRWNGYDASDYRHVVSRFDKVEEKKGEILKGEAMREVLEAGKKAKDEDGNEALVAAADGDDAKLGDDEQTGFQVVNKRVRTTGGGATGSVRNLRIREDTAKYLYNLDLNSAHYDPKTRAMRQDPNPDKPDSAFHGDNFQRSSGDSVAFTALNLHSVQAINRGQDVHMQGAPSQAENLYKEFRQRKEKLEEKIERKIIDKYGDASAKLRNDDERAMLLGQTEGYVEYDRAGRVVRGAEASLPVSRWEEDVYVNNHTSVWGSFWEDGRWGYKCCMQMVKNSFCTGAAGRTAAEGAVASMHENAQQQQKEERKMLVAGDASETAASRENGGGVASTSSKATEGEIDDAKLKDALERAERAEKEYVELDDRKRGYNSFAKGSENDVTAEEMEAYRMKRSRGFEDPMRKADSSAGGDDGGGTGGYDYV